MNTWGDGTIQSTVSNQSESDSQKEKSEKKHPRFVRIFKAKTDNATSKLCLEWYYHKTTREEILTEGQKPENDEHTMVMRKMENYESASKSNNIVPMLTVI